MYIVILTYRVPLEQVDAWLDTHGAFLDRGYAQGRFLCSGRRNPRVGGVILVRADTDTEVRDIMAEDPFYQQGIADYEFIAFVPTKYVDVLSAWFSGPPEVAPRR